MDAAAGSPRPNLLRLVAWVGVLTVAIVGLTLAGRGALAVPPILDGQAWRTWAGQRDSLTMVFAVLRLATLAAAWYLLGATIVGGAAHLVRNQRLSALVDVLTVPLVRRVLQGALGMGFAAAATLSAGSAAGTAPESPAPLIASTAAELEPIEMVPVTDAEAVMLPAPLAPPGAPAAVPQAADVWVVKPGDHFWSIAERTLTTAWGRTPSDAETTAYWQRLINTNKDRLDDPHNPDLVRPGQRFTLPPV